MRYITLTIAITALFTSSCDFEKYSFIKDSSSTTIESMGLGDAGNILVVDSSQNGGDATNVTTDGKLLTTESGTVCAQNELLCENGCVPNDMMNCGTCGHDCTALPHVIGSVVCSDTGECLVTEESCAPGWAHCSSQADRGCETDITQPANCGSCGNDCSQGSAILCAPQEAVSSDRPTYACSSECPEHAPTLCGDNSCVDTSTSTNHCGECGNSCPQTEHGEAICVDGKCGLECSTGYHPCDYACLSDTSTDSCGTSCEPCQVPANADPACDGIDCSYTCKEGFLSCDGSCLANDAKNCGSCGHDCTNLPHVSGNVDCDETGACIVPTESCTPGYAHCTSNPDQGCETDLSSTATCGSCNGKCPETAPVCSLAAGSTAEQPVYECTSGCSNPGTPDLCSGSCVNKLTSATNCGQCGKVCPTVANGQPTCVNGVCAITCNNGYHLCGNSCLDNASPDSCGTSCTPCSSGSNARAICNNGTCDFECVYSNYLECSDKSCVPNDDDNCGTCGNSCASGQRCILGVCRCNSASCPNGCCDDYEQCLSQSAQNAAACGKGGSDCSACASLKHLCINGICQLCGNGVPEGTEECDDGNSNNEDECIDNCKEADCGDGWVRAGSWEQCDYGNSTWAPICDSNCQLTTYGLCGFCDLDPDDCQPNGCTAPDPTSCYDTFPDRTCTPDCYGNTTTCPPVPAPWTRICFFSRCFIECQYDGTCPRQMVCAYDQTTITPGGGTLTADLCVGTNPY